MGLPSNWRSPGYADDYADHDFADFAQEFLRRNPEYQSDHAQISDTDGASSDPPKRSAAIADKWGLLFRLQSPGRSSHGARTLEARCRAGRAHAGADPLAVIGRAALPRPSSPDHAVAAVA